MFITEVQHPSMPSIFVADYVLPRTDRLGHKKRVPKKKSSKRPSSDSAVDQTGEPVRQ